MQSINRVGEKNRNTFGTLMKIIEVNILLVYIFIKNQINMLHNVI